MHACESELVVKSIIKTHVPYFNGKVFLANKQEIGSVEEILGPVNNYFFSVKLNEGFNARTFTPNTMVCKYTIFMIIIFIKYPNYLL